MILSGAASVAVPFLVAPHPVPLQVPVQAHTVLITVPLDIQGYKVQGYKVQGYKVYYTRVQARVQRYKVQRYIPWYKGTRVFL